MKILPKKTEVAVAVALLESEEFETPEALGAALVAWYRADDPGIVLASGNVATWPDKSGNGLDLTQATAGNQPAFTASDAAYNNRPTVGFTRGGDCRMANGSWATDQPMTVLLAGNTPALVGNSYICDFGGGRCVLKEASSIAGTALDNNPEIIAPSHLTAGTPAAMCGVFNNASSALYVNALTPAVTGIIGNGATLSTFTLGNYVAGTAAAGGPIAEFFVVNRVLTDLEIASALGYLGARYAIAIGA